MLFIFFYISLSFLNINFSDTKELLIIFKTKQIYQAVKKVKTQEK